MKVSIEEFSLLDELAEKVKSEPIQPDEVTVKMFCERTGYSTNGAIYYLDCQVKNGLLEKRKVMNDGHWISVYKRMDK